MKRLERFLDARFAWAIGLSCLFYFGIEVVYILRLPLVMDEFQGASAVHRLFDQVPYLDFKPYKTVLGYYLELPLMLLTDDPWQQIVFVKLGLALATSISIFFAARMLSRHFSTSAVFLATVVLVSMSTFLERSASLRVDMLTSLFGLFSLLFLMDRRLIVSGVLAGVSFLVSQKGVYFIFCAGSALGTHWLLHDRGRRAFVECLRFSASALAPIGAYFAIWAVVASAGIVGHEVFVKNQSIAFTEMYEIRHYWFQTAARNPYFWIVTILSLGQLFVLRHRRPESFRDSILLVYGGLLLGLCLWHKQPWPYFFVLVIPTCWVLIASFYHVEMQNPRGLSSGFLAILILLGVGFPAQRIPVVLARDNALQRSTVSVANQLMHEDETYLAGLSILHAHRHAKRLGWLDARRLNRLSSESPLGLIETLEEERLKLVITNYRIRQLPPALLDYLAGNYMPYVGNILLFAPTIEEGTTHQDLSFAGRYRLVGSAGATIEIDGELLQSGETVQLTEGGHHFVASQPFRLRLSPEGVDLPSDPRLMDKGILFDDVYGY